jgi:transglutaminase-like putative cysteine protease
MGHAEKNLAQAPYGAEHWKNLAFIYEQKQNKEKAIEAYRKCLAYDPNSFSARKQLRSLLGLKPISEILPKNNHQELIRKSKPSGLEGEDWYYVLYDRARVVYEEWASEEYNDIVVKILNEKGIDAWKEVYIPYSGKQSLYIEKAEVVKPGGQKVEAEKNDNSLVFTDLEPGDAVVIRYRYENYYYGKAARLFWDNYSFEGAYYMDHARYKLFVAPNIKFNHTVINGTLSPSIVDEGEFKVYTWEKMNSPVVKDEKLMPASSDVFLSLHISSLESWDDVAEWFADVSTPQIKADYQIKEVCKELVPANSKMDDTQKARALYDYIVKNIHYSSIPFRQSGFIPQKASKVFHTKLGDCKDLSTLYVTMAKEVGLEANMVLINTRDNGAKEMVLPSLNFNHCIVRVKAGKEHKYLELTDPMLPFACLTSDHIDAAILDIPKAEAISNLQLQKLAGDNRPKDKVIRKQHVVIDNNNLKIKIDAMKSGAPTARTRSYYANLTKEKQIEEFKSSVSSDFKNGITFHDLSFSGLDALGDSINYQYEYTAKNEVVNIGNMKTFKIPFSDRLIEAERINEDDRKFPFEYGFYENMDEYFEELTIEAPQGKQFIELPANISIKHKGFAYSFTIQQEAPNKVKIQRTFSTERRQFSAEEYKELKGFFEQVIEYEGKFVAFK